MSTLHYLAFLSLVVISFSTNRTCKFGDGDGNQVDSCTNVDYCYKYMINSTIKYGKGCDTDGICNNIGNNKCKCDSTVRDYSSPYINMICCCDSDNCDVSPSNYCYSSGLPTTHSSAVGSTFVIMLILFISFIL